MRLTDRTCSLLDYVYVSDPSLISCYQVLPLSMDTWQLPANTSLGCKSLPWVNREVRKCLRQRDKAHRCAKKEGSDSCWTRFCQLWNRAVKALRRAKQEFFSSMSAKIKSLKEFGRQTTASLSDGFPLLNPLQTRLTC